MTFWNCSKSIIRRSGLFDPKYYLLKNPDIRFADTDPLNHFIKFGWREDRNPSAHFDVKFYLETNPDVKRTGINPLVHYIKYGAKEGRRALPSDRFMPSKDIPKQLNNLNIKKKKRTESLRFFLEYTKSHGLRHSLKRACEKLFLGKELKKPDHQSSVNLLGNQPPKRKPSIKKVIEKIDKKISIIIPTKNAGDEFSFLMKVLRMQEGFREIEIVIVDSGSTDDTVEIAKYNNAKIVQIKPKEFTHSYARNLGAKNATGDYLLFTVQDALPPSLTWLYELFQVLKNEDVVAVSCAETPREDADLFYRQVCWNHYNFLGINDGDRIFSLPEKTDHISLRQNAQLSDLANLISREVFEKYQYRLGYAEDLDLGIRLIKDGYKIAFLGSVRIIHSHDRLPYYHLKRGYVDNQFLSDVFEDFVIPKITMEDFIPDLAFTYIFTNRLNIYLDDLPRPLTPIDFEEQVIRFFEQRHQYNYPNELPDFKNQYLDQKAQSFLEDLISTSGFQFADRRYDGFLTMAFLGYVGITFNYLKNTYEFIDDLLLGEIKECFTKSFSILAGSHLAYCNKNRTGTELQDMDKLHKTLMEGV